MNTDIMFSSATDQWATPQTFFDELDKEFRFTLDPCADETNHKCSKYYTKNDDGLKQDWRGERVFCNPPYGRAIKDWVKKCADGEAELADTFNPRELTRRIFTTTFIKKPKSVSFADG